MTCGIWKRLRDGCIKMCGDTAHVIMNNLVMCEPCSVEWARHLPSPTKSILLNERKGK